MLLRSEKSIRLHRNAKRSKEIQKIISEFQKGAGRECPGGVNDLRILEFGCGNGFQIPYLKQLGTVYATDIYTSEEMRQNGYSLFLESDSTQMPFPDKTFDIIFSNHVVEHLPEPEKTFKELRRIAKQHCLYVFSVPTNIWLLLSLPSKYLGKVSSGSEYVLRKVLGKRRENFSSPNDLEIRMNKEKEFSGLTKKHTRIINILLPKGHGVYSGFIECYKSFRMDSWIRFFTNSGFTLHSVIPLLLYGPSEFPLIPTISWPTKFGFCSSALFIMGTENRSSR